MFVDNLFSKINASKSHRYLYLTPHVYTVGNCSIEILYGIIAAKSRGKKLFIIYPFDIPFVFKWNITNCRVRDTSRTNLDVFTFKRVER